MKTQNDENLHIDWSRDLGLEAFDWWREVESRAIRRPRLEERLTVVGL